MELTHCKNGHEYNEANTYIYPRTGRQMCRACHRKNEHRRLNSSPENIQANRDRVRKWAQINPERAKESIKQSRKKYRDIINSYKTSCKECGESALPCLDFHHRDPKQKLFNIGLQYGKKPLEEMIKEIAKCDILCANCHRKLHAAERAAEKVS